ncbi:MAG TPA: MG2 domain-containing protein, partial [Cytophagales bacterium]|nr:MG2 domain-containing protein [Cytophagales bacterium]
MRRLLIWTSLIVLYANTIAQNTMNHSYKSAWDSLQKATDKGLIKDAIHINDGILARAKADHNAPEYLKAVIHKINFIKDREENGNRTSIVFIEKELAGATFPVKNLLHYLSATLYDDYYNNNRWQINQRTELDSSSQSMDIETWTTRQFFKKTTALYNASLENAAGLQKIKVSDYDAIITKSKGRHLRPTLFDFLAFEVFNHYDDQYDRDLTVQENFVITDDAYYADADVFVKLKPTSTNAYATKYNALLVLQSIIAFRKQQPEIPALIDAELIRLDFIDQLFTDKKKGEAYYKALSSLEKKYGKDSSSSQVSHRIAQYYQTLGSSYDAHKDTTQRWALKKAVDKCNEAISKYPKSYGASLCKQLLEMIKEQQLSFEGEEVISAGRPFKLYTKYKNLNEVEFRIYTINHTTLQKLTQKEERNYGEQNALKGYFAKISKSKPVRTKVLSLPQTNDFQLHSVELPFDPLAHGLYVVYVGPKGFTEQGLYTYELIQVSNLAYLENNSAGQKEIYVVNNHTGAAVPQARVEIWKEYYEYSKNRNVAQKIFDKTADAEGKVVAGNIWGDHYGSFFVNIKTKDDTLYNDLPSRYNNVRTPYGDTQEKVAVNEIKILTDRAIYRPGQTVYYKIIAFSNLNNKAEVLSKLSAAISLRDVNQKELVQHSFVTNEYGSAHGSFVLPSAGLTGYHTLQVVGNGVYGNQGMRVEEYKRPKFEAKFDTLRETYKLNDEVTVTVAALSYAGAAIDQAQVRYKVNRTYRYPEYWYKCGFYWLPTPKSVQISVGEASTDANGKAAIKFKAIPDQDAYQRDKAIFLYEVIADITDINGETRSATTYVNIGEASYQINTSIPERIVLERRANLSIQVENLNDQAIKNTAEVEIIKLQDPTKY